MSSQLTIILKKIILNAFQLINWKALIEALIEIN